jgi:hypothetical protein
MRILNFLFVILLIILFFGCKENFQNNITSKDNAITNKSNVDSLELTNLVRQVYDWNMNNEIDDFPYEY